MLPKKPIPARGFRPSGGRYLSSALDENTNRTAQIVRPRSSAAMNPMEMRNTLTLVSMSEHPEALDNVGDRGTLACEHLRT
jgi:hypothetical protein